MEKKMPAGTLEMTVDPRAEWKQLFNDAWRFERDFFYDPNMHGVDWNAMKTRYGKLLDNAVTRWDVNFVIGELISELSSSHTYRGGGDEPEGNHVEVGYLGCDWELKDGAYRVKKIIRGAPWDTEVRSPLAMSGVKVSEGDYVLAVNGRPVDAKKAPWAAFIPSIAWYGASILPAYIYGATAWKDNPANRKPIGSGPYTLKSFTQAGVVLTVRDSGYWQDLPKVKELRYVSYADNSAQTTALANGESEWSFVFIPNYQATFVSKDPKNHKVWAPGVLGIHGLYINTTVKPFDDPKLRQAMNMVVNRADIFHQAEAGYFHPQIDSVTGLPAGAGDAFVAPEYKGKTMTPDVEGAKALLQGAGYKLNGTTLTDPAGKPVKITLTDPAPWSDYQTTLEILKTNFAQIGIDATVDKANQDKWDQNIQKGDFGATMRWTNGGATPYDIYQTVMDGDLLKPIGTAAQQGNFGRFKSPEATAALKAYANATSDAQRTAAMNQIQKVFVEQAPMLPVGSDNVGGAYSTKNWIGWPSDADPYAGMQPTQPYALDVVLHLKPANS